MPNQEVHFCRNCGYHYLSWTHETPDIVTDEESGLTCVRVRVLPTSVPFNGLLRELEIREFLGGTICAHSQFIAFSAKRATQLLFLRVLEERHVEEYDWGKALLNALQQRLASDSTKT